MKMNVHPPENQAEYTNKAITLLLAAALPAAQEQLKCLIREQESEAEKQSA